MCNRVELEGVEQDSQGRGNGDRAGDPIFPLMPKVLEAIREKAQELANNESRGMTSDEYSMVLETICGVVDDSQPVEQYDGTLGVTQTFVNQNQAAVGQIQWNDNLASVYTNPGNVSGVRWCSGTLISNDLFLTAGHCFDQTGGGWDRPRTNGTSNLISSSEIATNMRVNFNYQVDPSGTPRTEVSFPITELIEYRLGGLDFAIVRLGGNPGSQFGTTPLATNDAAAGNMLCIIGHPAGQRKRIEAGPALSPQGDRIRYDDIDTLGGNSGSGVLRASDGRIVGVHTNGGCTAASPNGANANTGMRITSMIAASPTLTRLTRPAVGTAVAGDIAATVRGLDQFNTNLAADLGRFTISALDVASSPALDLLGTIKSFDDVKFPALDKSPRTDAKLPGVDNIAFDPGAWVRTLGSARPFVLSTPHQTMAWTGSEASEQVQQLRAAVVQTGELLEQYQEAIQVLASQYQELTAALDSAETTP